MGITLLLVLASFALQEKGGELGPNEIFRVATDHEANPNALAHTWFPQAGASYGRVVDAFTRRPIEGATVESWTEELNTRAAGHELISSVTTRSDGCFLLTRAGKGRASAAGYATSTDIAIYEGSVVELFPLDTSAPPPRIRFVDTTGQPIPNVRVTSTLTCAHDVPALDLYSDHDGRVTLPNFGFQNWVPELRFRADGFRGIKYFDGDRLLVNSREHGEQIVVLPRRLHPIDLQILDDNGEACADLPMHFVDGDGYHVVRSDAQGLVRIESRYDGSGIIPIPFGKARNVGRLPNTDLTPPHRVSLRFGGDEWEEDRPDLPLGRMRAEAPPGWLDQETHGDLKALLIHEAGWFSNLSTKDLASGVHFPAGKAVLYLGGSNANLEQGHLQLNIHEHETTVIHLASFTEARRPMQLIWPEAVWIDWVEHAGETISKHQKYETLYLSPDEAVHFRWHSGKATFQRTVSAAEWKQAKVIDLSDLTKAVLIDDAWLRKRVIRECDIVFAGIPEDTWSSSWIRSDTDGDRSLEDIDALADGHLRYRLTAPAGAEVLVRVRVTGYRPYWLRKRMASADASLAAPVSAHPIQAASLRLLSEQPIRFIGDAEPTWLAELDPGPLQLTFSLGSEEMYRLELNIEAGEHREIDLDQLHAKLKSESKK